MVSEILYAHGRVQTARGMCSDEAPHAEIDKQLGYAVDAVKDVEDERDRLCMALRELYAGCMDDSMPGTALVEWHERHPWAEKVVR